MLFRSTKILAVVVLIVAAGIALSSSMPPRLSRLSQNRGRVITTALEQYRVEKGVYPNLLEELSPKHLSSVPKPLTLTRKWRYTSLLNGSDYLLSFDEGFERWPTHVYQPG